MIKDFTTSAIDQQNILVVPETDFGSIAKTPQLSVFDFHAFLNLRMLLSGGLQA